MSKIKICGISTVEAAKACIDGRADFIGFIFFDKSPRNITLEKAKEIAKLDFGTAKKVAVTVNATDNEFDNIVEALNPDYLQLHGDETACRIKDVKAEFSLPIIKALPASQISEIKDNEFVDYYLIDSPIKSGNDMGGIYGGSGKVFDWDKLTEYKLETPYFLSGGLNIDNIDEALKLKPYAVDLSSGVESAKGIKDIAKIEGLLPHIKHCS